ncbi:hypothetical protein METBISCDRAFT_21359 [Metschnikowia bicuspidata]|uniref:Uncharacterized protein n=1 Tax=Metschnikowia bicuspidata TaxID=27322 RepID=A0A4P9ZHN6_9ASCO|nr:hypothetical protein METBISCDRAFT_21359 [Metschnikowia bicuspidata]
MGWFLVGFRILLFGTCVGQGTLATLEWAWDPQNVPKQLIAFIVSSFVFALAQPAALLWRTYLNRYWYTLYLVLALYVLGTTASVAVYWAADTKSHITAAARVSTAVTAGLSVFSMFLVGLSFQSNYLRQMPSDVEEPRPTTDPDSVSAEWRSVNASSEELSLNKSHCTHTHTLAPSARQLHYKDSEKTLVGQKLGPTKEEFDAVTESWLVRSSMAQNTLDDHLGENWMTACLQNPLVGDLYLGDRSGFVQSRNYNYSYHAQLGLGRSNTTGQLFMKRVRSKTYMAASATRDPGDYHIHRAGKSHHRALSMGGTECLSKGAVLLLVSAHNASASQEIHQKSLIANPSSTAELFWASSECSLPNLLGKSSDGTVPITPDKPHFASPHQTGATTRSAVSSIDGILDGIEDIKAGVKWAGGPFSIKHISLQEWERKKQNWLACEPSAVPSTFFASLSAHTAQNLSSRSSFSAALKHDLDTPGTNLDRSLLRSVSAPSLHTYRPAYKTESRRSLFLNLDLDYQPHILENALYRVHTPPPLTNAAKPSFGSSSPIKKMFGFIRRDLLDMPNNRENAGHKHAGSVTASMVSSASARSSRSGLPRKAIKGLFSRALAAEQTVKPFAFAATPRMSPHKELPALVYAKPKIPSVLHFLYWESDTLDGLDGSRVSSTPSAVIGEYDREKWRTLKELNSRTNVQT